MNLFVLMRLKPLHISFTHQEFSVYKLIGNMKECSKIEHQKLSAINFKLNKISFKGIVEIHSIMIT